MMLRKKRIVTITIIISLIIIITGLILGYLMIATDTFKSNKELFGKYILKTTENVEKFITKNEQDLLNEAKYNSDLQLKMNYTTDINTTAENQKNDLNSLVLHVDSQIDKSNDYDYKKIYLQKEEQDIGKIEYIKDKENYGIRVDGVKQFVSVEGNDLKELSEDLGFSDEQIKNIPNSINDIKFDLSNLKLTEEEKTQISNTYLNIINENVSKNNFSKQKNALITVGDKDVNTDAYTLTLNKEEYNNLKIKVLEQLQKDEIILSKIETIQNQIDELYKENALECKRNYIENIQNTIEEIRNTNIGQEEVKITVYVSSKKTVRILVDDKETKNTVDFIEENENMAIEANIIKYDTVENSIVATLKKEIKDNENKISMTYERIKDEEIQKLQIEAVELFKGDNVLKTLSTIYNNGTNQISLNVENDIEIVDSLNDTIELDDKNNIVLNELESKKASNIVKIIENKISEQFNSIKNNVNEGHITSALSIFSVGENIEIGEGEISEHQKNRFNSQFEFYQGDEVDTNSLKELLSILKNNTSKAEIVSGDKDEIKIRIIVKSGKKDDEGIERIEELLNDRENSNKKYKVRIGYSENGIINAIAIVYVKE